MDGGSPVTSPESSNGRDSPANHSRFGRRVWIAATLAIACASSAVFWVIHARGVHTDIPSHAGCVIPLMHDGVVVGNPLFYVLTGLLSGLSLDPATVLTAAYVLLAMSVVARFGVSAVALGKIGSDAASTRRRTLVLATFAVALQFAFSLPSPRFYPGPLPPNVWHNSTTLVLVPLAVMAHVASARFLGTGSWKDGLVTAAWVGVGILAKPSYFLVWAPAFTILILASQRTKAMILRGAVAVSIGGVVFLAQYFAIYVAAAGNLYFERAGAASVAIRPFTAILRHASSPMFMFLGSFLFPLAFLMLRYRAIRRSRELLLAFTCLGFALLEGSLLAETGVRAPHGNLLWQVIVANFLVFLFAGRHVAEEFTGPRPTRIGWLLAATFALHVASGVVYLLYGLGVKGRLMWV